MPRLSDARGFTLIETLVVILVVGLLAAIAVPMLLSQKGKAHDVGAKQLAGSVVRAFAIYRSEHDESYACGATCLADLRRLDDAIPAGGVSITAYGSHAGTPSRDAYRVTVDSPSGRRFWIDKDAATGDHARGCTSSGGGCDGGSW